MTRPCRAHRANPLSPLLATSCTIRNRGMPWCSKMRDRNLRDYVNIVIVADHGMTTTYDDKRIFLEDYIDLGAVDAIVTSPVLMLGPRAGAPASVTPDSLLQALHGAHPNLSVWSKDAGPARFHYGSNRRIKEVVGVVDVGWSVYKTHADAEHPWSDGGAHGYDNEARDMQATFIASGPSFLSGVAVDSLANVHVYPLLCHLIGVAPAPNNGSLAATSRMLA